MAPTTPPLPDPPDLADVLRAYPYTVRPLLEYHDLLLRHDHSPFSIGQRELLAAYVSGLNQCGFCYGSHKIIASTFGVSEDSVDQLLRDPEEAGVDPAMSPVLAFARALTEAPSRVTPEHRQAVIDAGWPHQAIFDAASICGLFNMMNRIADGMGVQSSAAIRARQRERHARDSDGPAERDTYQRYGRAIGALPPPDSDDRGAR